MSITFDRPEFLIGYGIISFIVIIGFLWAAVWKRRRIPGDPEVAKDLGKFPTTLRKTGFVTLCLLALGGYFFFLSRPMAEFRATQVLCKGPFVVFVRDVSDSMKKEDAVAGLPEIAGARPNAFYAATVKIREIVKQFDCFQAALVDFQEEAGVVINFTPIPEKRALFLEALERKPIFHPGSRVASALITVRSLIEERKDIGNGEALIVLFSDGADEAAKWQLQNPWSNVVVTETLNDLMRRGVRMFGVGTGIATPGFITVYDPDRKEFVEFSGPQSRRVGRYDGAFEYLVQVLGGAYFIFEEYPKVVTKGSERFEDLFGAFVKEKTVITGERVLPKQKQDLGWYFFFVGTLAFMLAAGFLARIGELFRRGGRI